MATAAQITANRANSQKSTGPRTPEGKQNSRTAVTRHGLRVSDAVLRQEQPEEYARLLASYTAEFSPKPDSTEEELVRQLTFATLRLHRIDKAELSHLQQFAPEPATTSEGCTGQIGAMYLADTTGPCHLALLDRYRGSAERSFWRALKALQAAQPRYTAREAATARDIELLAASWQQRKAPLAAEQSPEPEPEPTPQPKEPMIFVEPIPSAEANPSAQPKNPISPLLLLLCLALLFGPLSYRTTEAASPTPASVPSSRTANETRPIIRTRDIRGPLVLNSVSECPRQPDRPAVAIR